MAGDGIVKIGAQFDKTNVDAGLGDTQEMVKASMAAITTTIVEAGAKSKAAWKGLTDEVKAAAQTISGESLKVAEATKAQAAAYADLRRATTLAKDASQDELATTAILAAAQHKAAEAAAAVAEAKQAEAEAVAAANAKAELSENFLVATFQRAEMAIGESLAGMRERLVLTSETAHISARDITSAFSGLGELLGVGLLAGFAGDYLDELAKMNVQLDHLSTETGISVTNLAGLQQIVKEMGGEWEPMERALVLFEQNLVKVSLNEAEYTRAIQAVGLSWEELKGHSPEQQLSMVAEAFANTADQERVAYAAKELFGRGGQQLIPILKEQGAGLEENMKKTGALTGITKESAEAARRWTKDVADLTMEFRTVMMPVMEHAADVISGVAGVFEAGAAVIVSAFEGIGTAVTSVGYGVVGFAKIMADITSGRLLDVAADAEQARNDFVNTWKSGFKMIGEDWAEVAKRFKAPPPMPELPKGIELGDMEAPGKHARAPKAARTDPAIKADEDALNQLKLTHEMTVEEEIAFWEKRLAAAKKGSAEYRAIVAKLAPLEQREMKKPQETTQVQSPDLGAAGLIQQSDLDKAVKANSDAIKAEVDADRAGAEEKMRIAAEDYRDVEANSAFEVQMGRMTADQRLQVLRQAAMQEEQIRRQQSAFIAALDMNDARRYEADLRQQEQAQRQWARLIMQLNQQTALESQKVWKQAWGTMTADLNAATSQWVAYGQGFEQSMAKSMGGISSNFAQNVMKMMEQEILAAIQHKALAKDSILTDAKTAAGNSYKWASNWGGPIAGAIAAAAAFAGVLAFDSFADGGVVRGGGGMAVPILAHAGERVLSQSQTENFHKMVDQSTSSSHASSTTHLHLQQNVNAYDRSGMRSTLKAHADDLLDIVQAGITSGRLKPA